MVTLQSHALPIFTIKLDYDRASRSIETSSPFTESIPYHSLQSEKRSSLSLSPYYSRPLPKVHFIFAVESQAVYRRLQDLQESKRPFRNLEEAAEHSFPATPFTRIGTEPFASGPDDFALIPRIAITVGLKNR